MKVDDILSANGFFALRHILQAFCFAPGTTPGTLLHRREAGGLGSLGGSQFGGLEWTPQTAKNHATISGRPYFSGGCSKLASSTVRVGAGYKLL